MAEKKHIFRVVKNSNYSVICNVHLQDKNLSWKAKGIHSYILSLPDDWEIRINHLITISKDGERATRSGIKELYDNKYWQKYPVYVNGKVDHWETKISEVPFHDEEIIQSIIYKDGKKIINYKYQKEEKAKTVDNVDNVDNGKTHNKTQNLLCQNSKVDEHIENTNVDLLCQNVDVGNVHVENQRLLNTNNILNTDFNKNSVSQSKKSTDMTEIFHRIKKQAQINTYLVEEERKLLEKAIYRLINSDQLKINNEIVTQEEIKEKLLQLRVEMCDYALEKYRQMIYDNLNIKNKFQYFCVLLYNAIDEYYAELY